MSIAKYAAGTTIDKQTLDSNSTKVLAEALRICLDGKDADKDTALRKNMLMAVNVISVAAEGKRMRWPVPRIVATAYGSWRTEAMKEERQDIDNKLLAAAGLLICDIDTALKTLDRYFEIDILWAHDEQLALLKGQQQQARQLIKQLARECNATRVEARRHMLGLRQGT